MSHPCAKFIRLVLSCALVLLVAACGGGGKVPFPADSGVTLRALPSDISDRKAVSYSPFRTIEYFQGGVPTHNPPVNELNLSANIATDLALLNQGGFRLIRLFDSSDRVSKVVLQTLAAHPSWDIKVVLGIYVVADDAISQPEIARGVALAKDLQFKDIIAAVSVGNETMVNWSYNKVAPTVMAGHLKSVRDQITQPVTTDDNYAFYAGHGRNAADQAADVFRQIDFASIHTYSIEDVLYSNSADSDPLPDWDWQQLAVTDVTQRASAMMDAAIGKTQTDYALARSYLDKSGRANLPIVIGETGWKAADPSGNGRYKYLGSPANQKMYYTRLLDWALASRTGSGPKGIVYFEAFDELWKGSDDNWGLFNRARQARCAAQALNPTASWAKDTGACAESAALYFSPPVPNAAVATPTLDIFNQSVTGWPAGMRADQYGGGVPYTLGYPVTGDHAPSDVAPITNSYLSLNNFLTQANSYGWGLLWQSSAVPAATANMSNFANGSIHFSIKTAYVGSLRISISSDTVLGAGAEADVLVSNGTYGYCNTGTTWCDVSIPVSAFLAANPKLDLRLILTRFSIADIWSATGNTARSGMPEIRLDNIYWKN